MKRVWICFLMLAMLCSNAMAALEYNSFFDDDANAGRFDANAFAWHGDYVYWLYEPEDSLTWIVQPQNVYRMKPGAAEAEMVLQGREDFQIYDMLQIGDKLLLSVADEEYGQAHPVLFSPENGKCEKLPGNIGSVVMGAGKIYNSVDGAIYEIDIDTLKPKKIYTYPREIAGDNPVMFQCEGLNLYFCTDSFDQYRLDLQMEKLIKIANIRGDGFVKDYKFYVSDYDNGGTYCYDLANGKKMKVSDGTYRFEQGHTGGYVRAALADEENFGDEDSGRVFDLTWMQDDLEETLAGKCKRERTFMLNGVLYRYDIHENRIDFSGESVAELLKK